MRIAALSRALRPATALLLSCLFFAMANPAHAATYRLWYQHAQEKVYKTTPAPSSSSAAESTARTLGVSAALGEHEGKQVIIRPGSVGVTDVWLEPSDFTGVDASGNAVGTFSADNIEVFKVGYVTIKRASTGFSRLGHQPDPLIPMRLANGKPLGWLPSGLVTDVYRRVSAGTTQPFYVLFKIPEDATAGTYSGSVTVTSKGLDGSSVPTVTVPITMEIYPFSIASRTLPTSFGLSLSWAAYANSPSHRWLSPDTNPSDARVYEHDRLQYDQVSRWYRYFDEHRLSPQTSLPAWERSSSAPGSDGTMTARPPYLADFLSEGPSSVRPGEASFGFNTIRAPEWPYRPSFMTNPFSSAAATAKAAQYLMSMRSALGTDVVKAYAYPVDEPEVSEKAFVERYAALIHRYAPGVRFLLPTDGYRWGYRPLKGVDIYVQRIWYYYADYARWVAPLRKSGKRVWIYTHASKRQSESPMVLIDKPLGDIRSLGYFSYSTKASGLLYYNVNRWAKSYNLSTYRDPYRDTMSHQAGTSVYANGDGSLVYPGYYPAHGLNVQGAGPVGSLRMEALRDGLEDYEYLRLVSKRHGSAVANTVLVQILGAKSTVRVGGKPTFPSYYKGSWRYEQNHRSMAALLR